MERCEIDKKALARSVVGLIDWAWFRNLAVLRKVKISSPQIQTQINIALQRPKAPSTLSHTARLSIISIAGYEASQIFQVELGESFSDPSREQLESACNVVEIDASRSSLLCALASTVLNENLAQEHCARLLEERYSVEIPRAEPTAPIRAIAPAPAAPPYRPRLKSSPKKTISATPPVVSRRKKKSPDIATLNTPLPIMSVEPSWVELEPATRWVPQLTPKLQAEGFDVNHPLVGSIVWAVVRFHDRPGYKERPSVIIAVKKSASIVRGLYSHPGPRKKTFTVWQHYDLDRLGSISETDEFALALPVNPRVIARLSDEHWNLLR